MLRSLSQISLSRLVGCSIILIGINLSITSLAIPILSRFLTIPTYTAPALLGFAVAVTILGAALIARQSWARVALSIVFGTAAVACALWILFVTATMGTHILEVYQSPHDPWWKDSETVFALLIPFISAPSIVGGSTIVWLVLVNKKLSMELPTKLVNRDG
jgi:hypothetical protein